MKKYEEIDVVVCPSRNDPMPVVVTEGMMMKKVCIVSEDVGQATILTDGESGLICRTGDAEDLCKKMKWAIDHKDRCVEMGNKAHELYKQFFSMEKFEHNVMKIMECLE